MGATFDWSAEVVTADPDYYKWNQWLFLRFLEAGLAYREKSPVDWCPNDGTLAREQVEGADRHCWRCGAKVEKRDLDQWYLRVTKYADELLDFSGIQFPDPIRIHADELDRPVRGRARSSSGPRRRRITPAARSCGSSRPGRTRCSGRRSWSSPRSIPLVAELTAPDRRAEVEAYVARAEARDGDRAALDRPREDRRPDRRRRDQPGQRRADPDLRRRLRPGRLRDRRDHGRPGPRRARLRVRREVRPADPARRRGARRGGRARSRVAEHRRTPSDEAWSTAASYSGLTSRTRAAGEIVDGPRAARRGPAPRSRTACATG